MPALRPTPARPSGSTIALPPLDELRPMLATAATVLPSDAILPGPILPGPLPGAPAADADPEPGWWYEFKWDGVRALGALADGALQLRSRSGRDITVAYPELTDAAQHWTDLQAVLDGEIVMTDAAGRPDFGLLQARMHVGDATTARRLAAHAEVVFLVFDVLALDGRVLLGEPYRVRRQLLESLTPPAPIRVPPAFGGGAPVAQAVLAAAAEQCLEGVVAKRADSGYEPGRRSRAWLKVKLLRRQTVVIGGWEPGAGGRAGQIGALLLGVHAGGALRYAGQVGTGFSAATLADLQQRLDALRRPDSPFPAGDVPRPQAREAVWVHPQLVAEVEYTAWTREGRLRHPSFKGLRTDVGPQAAVLEPIAPVPG